VLPISSENARQPGRRRVTSSAVPGRGSDMRSTRPRTIRGGPTIASTRRARVLSTATELPIRSLSSSTDVRARTSTPVARPSVRPNRQLPAARAGARSHSRKKAAPAYVRRIMVAEPAVWATSSARIGDAKHGALWDRARAVGTTRPASGSPLRRSRFPVQRGIPRAGSAASAIPQEERSCATEIQR
jgi:hypothetical protein